MRSLWTLVATKRFSTSLYLNITTSASMQKPIPSFHQFSIQYLVSFQHQRMSQGKLEKTESDKEEPIKYGDVFNVKGDLVDQKVAPGDAAMMQAAENKMFGYIQKGGPSSVMQSAANKNEKAGFVGHNDITNVTSEGLTISETDLPGKRMITELIRGQVVGQDNQKLALAPQTNYSELRGCITIGEALEATVLTAGNRPVDYSDAAAIQAAEVRATGRTNIIPGGVAAAAQSAATRNARATREEDKTKLAEVLAEASSKLPADKPVTRRDAEGVIGAELRNDPNLCTRPGGVAASVAAAARLNQGCQIPTNHPNQTNQQS